VKPRVANAVYVLVALMWLVRDWRIERALARMEPPRQEHTQRVCSGTGYGSFVVNSREQIERASEDYQLGRLGELDRSRPQLNSEDAKARRLNTYIKLRWRLAS
jgi:hypothetical protein